MGQVFVGRKIETDALVRLFDEASGGNGQVAFLVGEPGIGKTRLAEEVARLAEGRGARVVWGRAWEGGGTPPFWPWRQALRRLVPAGDGLLHADDRTALYETVSDAIRAATAEAPAVIVFDDMHIADLSSLELLRFVARDLRGARALVLITSRELSLFASSEASAILEKTAREAMVIPLAPLQRGDLARWIDLDAPTLASDVDLLLERSDGNPLFIRELMAVARSGALANTLPIGIRSAIRDHLALLSDATRSALETLAVGGREVDRPTLSALGATLPDEAFAKGILVEGDNGAARFTHVLLRDELYAAIPASRRAELHRRISRVTSDPASALHHALEGDAERADLARTATAAVKDAISRHAFDDAAALGARAIARVEDAELLIATAEALTFMGRREDAIKLCTAAADLAPDPQVLARAALTAAHEPDMTPRPNIVRLLRRAEAALGPEDSPLRAIVLGRLARAMMPPAPHEVAEYIDLRTRSIEMARRVGSRKDVLDALRLATEGFLSLIPVKDQYELNAEVIALAEELGRSAQIVPLLPFQVANRLQLGDATGAWREVARAEQILARLDKTPPFRWRAPLIRALMLVLEGRFDEAEVLQHRALDAARAANDRMGILMVTIQRTMLFYYRGHADDALDDIAADVQTGVPLTELFASLDHAIAGRREETRACLARFDPKNAAGIPGVATLGWPVVQAGLVELAPTFIPLVEDALPQGPLQFGPAALVTMGPMNLLLGRLYHMVGRFDDAEAALVEARAFSEKIGAKPCVAQADRVLAEIRARRGAAAPAPAAAQQKLQLTRDGGVCRLEAGATQLTLKDTRGLAYLDELLRRPHREVHVLELTQRGESGDAGPLLDGPAKTAYRDRIAELRAAIDEASAHNDPGRIERLQGELDAVTKELLRAVGLGGRDRLAGNRSELARSSVQRRLRDVVRRVSEQSPALGRHLDLSLKTGTFCMYAPTWPD